MIIIIFAMSRKMECSNIASKIGAIFVTLQGARQMTGKLDAGDNAARLAELLSPRLVWALAAISRRCGFFRRAGGRLRACADGDSCAAPGIDRYRAVDARHAKKPVCRNIAHASNQTKQGKIGLSTSRFIARVCGLLEIKPHGKRGLAFAAPKSLQSVTKHRHKNFFQNMTKRH